MTGTAWVEDCAETLAFFCHNKPQFVGSSGSCGTVDYKPLKCNSLAFAFLQCGGLRPALQKNQKRRQSGGKSRKVGLSFPIRTTDKQGRKTGNLAPATSSVREKEVLLMVRSLWIGPVVVALAVTGLAVSQPAPPAMPSKERNAHRARSGESCTANAESSEPGVCPTGIRAFLVQALVTGEFITVAETTDPAPGTKAVATND